MAERQFSMIRREFTANEAEVEWTEETDGHTQKHSLEDESAPPHQALHDAMDGLKDFIGAPFMVDPHSRNKIRPLRIKLSQKNETLFVKMHGAFLPEGFNNLVHIHVPKQEAEGKLFAAVQRVIEAGDRYVEGDRGQDSLLDGNGEDGEEEEGG